MKSKIAAIIAFSMLATPAFALAEHGADDMLPEVHTFGSASTTAGVPGAHASTTIKDRIENRMDRREDRRDDRQEARKEVRDDRQEMRQDRRDAFASSTASSTKPFKRPLPRFLSWIFGQSDDTTIGDLKAQIIASSSASSSPARVHFIERLRSLFHF